MLVCVRKPGGMKGPSEQLAALRQTMSRPILVDSEIVSDECAIQKLSGKCKVCGHRGGLPASEYLPSADHLCICEPDSTLERLLLGPQTLPLTIKLNQHPCQAIMHRVWWCRL
jgi:hypothetical protein